MSLSPIICNICNNKKTNLFFEKSGKKIMRCNNCNCLFVYPMTTSEHQKKWYDESYKDGIYKTYLEKENIRRKVNQRRFQDISKYLSNGTHLDVGCSAGYFLDVAFDKGFSTYGVELSEESIKKINPKHKDIFQGSLENSNLQNLFFDLITMYDFIEHVIDPNLTIKTASEKIKPGGILVISTPDITSWHAKLMGKKWGIIAPEEHLYYFSPVSIRFLLEKHGFGIMEIKKDLKLFTLHDMFKVAEFYYPTLFKFYQYFKKLIPKNWLFKERLFYFGDILVVAKKSNS